MRTDQAFLFDLDGTRVDSVYQHVLAWQEALDAAGIEVSVWRIHRKIGMSGGLFANASARPGGREPRKSKGPGAPAEAAKVSRCRADASQERAPRRPESWIEAEAKRQVLGHGIAR